MCGIAGIVGQQITEEDKARAGKVLAALSRRGPDDEGRAEWPQALLLHRRLAVLDVSSAGHQPMLSEDGSIGVVFNGCIYNFRELRAELSAEGAVFHSQCDTEVILRGYERWGAGKLVPRLRGMFAIAIWENRRGRLTLLRDRLGVKPLCYSVTAGRLAFASTPMALRAAGEGAGISPEALLEFLEFGYVTDAHCVFEGIRKLPPASMLVWERGAISETVYWRCDYTPSSPAGFAEAVSRTEELLLDSVKVRLQTDVPIAALLSAGIDSTLVCWALSKLGSDLRTYTVSLPGEQEDESRGAAETARLLGLQHETVVVDPAEGPNIESLTNAFSEPFACYSAMAMVAVSSAIAHRATVVLTGDGGDETYLGYPVHQHALLAAKIARYLPPGSPGAVEQLRKLMPANGSMKRLGSLLSYATGGLGAATRNHDGLPFYQEHGLLGKQLQGPTLAQRQIPASLAAARNFLPELLAFNARTELSGEFLTKVDGATMFYALEARSPFLDHHLWEYAASLDFGVRLRGKESKSILRHIVKDRVGESVAARPKRGFNIPVFSWMLKAWRPRLEALAGSTCLTRCGFIEQAPLARIIQTALQQQKTNIHLWRLLVLEDWLSAQ